MSKIKKQVNKQQRKKRVSEKVKLVSDRPRLHIYRSNKYIYAQVIDNKTGSVLAAASEKQGKNEGTKSQRASKVGEQLAEKAKSKKVTKVAFNRGQYKFHGRVKAVADGARKAGLKF